MTQHHEGLDAIRRLAASRFGFACLGAGQEEAIQALLDRQDVLCVLPTGAGKSAVYQLVGLHARLLVVVVSPLIALQRDQVTSLDAIAPGLAVEVNSTLTEVEREEVLDDLRTRGHGFLFLAPEQLVRSDTLAWLESVKPGLVVVDEAHCVSEWGQDFRQDYLRIGAAIDALGHPPVLALTATASPPVRREIAERLHLENPQVIVAGFDRPTIHLAVVSFDDEDERTTALVDGVVAASFPGIVYAATRKASEEIAEALVERGVRAAAYHAGLKASVRAEVQEAFMEDRVEVIVATTAFGMGIDKPNVRFVYHHGASDSLDAYYQEIGRAGRDGEPAEAILFATPTDFTLKRFQAGAGQLESDDVEPVILALRNLPQPVEPSILREHIDLTDTRLNRVLNRLEDVDALELRADGTIDLPDPGLDPEAAAQAAVAEQRHRQRFAQSKLEMMRHYVDHEGCRRAFLLQYFGEPYPGRCGHCDVCDRHGGTSADRAVETAGPYPIGSRVRHVSLGDGTVTHAGSGEITVLFDRGGYRTLSVELVQEGELLAELAA
ncbi:MAG: RecQ family ATP-dependent DNA helicase [Thermomicrobiales bacterium]